MTRGSTYDERASVGVLPRNDATSFIAADHRPLARRLRVARLVALRQGGGGEHRRVPGAEVLGGRLEPRRTPDVVVDVARVEVVPRPALLVRQEPLLGRSAPAPHHSRPPRPRRGRRSRCRARRRTCRRSEDQRRSCSPHVPPLERGEPEAAVLVGVHVVADPEVAEVEQPYGDGAGAVRRHALGAEVDEHPLARLRQRLAELEHPVELLGVPPGPPLRVVEVLPPAGVVGADRLQVTVRLRGDPDVASTPAG